MDASIEMKVQKLDELIELRKKAVELQKELGVDIGIYESNILIHDLDEFVDLANYLDGDVQVRDACSVIKKEIKFLYREIWLGAFVQSKELESVLSRIKNSTTDTLASSGVI